MRAIWIVLPLLAACVGTTSSDGPGRIEMSSGAATGSTETLVLTSDGSYTTTRSGPFGTNPTTTTVQLDRAAYGRARGLLEQRFPDLEGMMVPGLCDGNAPSFTVRVEPPIKRQSMVTQCRGREIATLISELRATIAQ